MDRKRKKIIVLHPDAGVTSGGGSQLNAIELASYLSAFFDVELLSAKKCSPYSKVIPCITRSHVKVLQNNKLIDKLLTKAMTAPGLFIEAFFSFLIYFPYLLFKQHDVLYPNNDYGGLFLARVLRKIKGTPFIYTEHAGMKSEGKVLKRNLAFNPDHFIVFNAETKAFTKSISPNQPVSVIPNGVDLSHFSNSGTQYSHNLNGKVVLFVASLQRLNLKRLDLLIEAVNPVGTLSLLVCGTGPDLEYYKSMAIDTLGDYRVHFVSANFEDMPSIYRSADLFSLPSKDEPFGRVYLEAMACGIPVVAPDDSMRREILGKGGLVCDVENILEYTKTLKQAIAIEWEDLPIKQAYKFSWNEITKKYVNAINSVIIK
jgi:glycosyltransferase involved in cell wall biosynthesis